jgi:hypothetical protein
MWQSSEGSSVEDGAVLENKWEKFGRPLEDGDGNNVFLLKYSLPVDN